jgi:predicted transcriptional regulator
MRKRRSKNKILQEILNICAKGENITQIVYMSNTNFTTVKYYIESMMESNLLEMIDGSPVLYKTTAKGMEVRNRLRMLQDELDGAIGKTA